MYIICIHICSSWAAKGADVDACPEVIVGHSRWPTDNAVIAQPTPCSIWRRNSALDPEDVCVL